MNVPFRVARVARIVRDDADGRAGAVEVGEQFHHRLAAARVEVPGRLVGQQDQRLASDGARDRDALLLSARQLAWQVSGAMRHADPLRARFGA